MKNTRKYYFVIAMLIILVAFLFLCCDKVEENKNHQFKTKTINIESKSRAKDQWIVLFDGTGLSNWQVSNSGSLKVEDVTLSLAGSGDIWTKERYGDFVLECEFNISHGGNSGIFFRTDDLDDMVQTGIEMQILDSAGKPDPDKHDCGAIYDLLEPYTNAANPAGEWNKVAITCNDNLIKVVLNGENIIDMDLDKWVIPNKNPDGTDNKFNNALKDFAREGYIGFQYHGDLVWYRNVRIKKL